jgi:predicted  nucleic acid-binding Zn-ribbon protein
MKSIKQIREAIDSGLDKLQAKAEDAADAAEEREMAAEFDAMVEAYATQAAALEAELQAMEEQYDEKA